MATDENGALKAGDLCHHGSNLLPTYRVVWVDQDRVWLRDVNTDADAVVSIGQCHRLAEHLESELFRPAEETAIQPTGLTWPDGTPRP